MRAQLEIQDKEGMTVAMHAAKSGSVAILSAVMGEITRTGVRDVEVEGNADFRAYGRVKNIKDICSSRLSELVWKLGPSVSRWIVCCRCRDRRRSYRLASLFDKEGAAEIE